MPQVELAVTVTDSEGNITERRSVPCFVLDPGERLEIDDEVAPVGEVETDEIGGDEHAGSSDESSGD